MAEKRDDKAERLASALRENLKKRKAQARAAVTPVLTETTKIENE